MIKLKNIRINCFLIIHVVIQRITNNDCILVIKLKPIKVETKILTNTLALNRAIFLRMNTKILVLCVIGSIVAFATAHGFNDYNGEYETEPESVEIGDNEISEEGIQPMGNFGNQQWTGQHWNSNPYNGFYYPTQPSNLNRNWYLPNGFNPHHHGNFN
uniref:Uncharacterized protein n=1 Tax=Strongyloides papillosus TaxID=174720 RepID=A0A0N5BZL6_STREA